MHSPTLTPTHSLTHLPLSTPPGIPAIVSIMRSEFVEVQREAGRTLSNLAAHKDNHEIIYNHGGHSLLVSYCLSPDTACQR